MALPKKYIEVQFEGKPIFVSAITEGDSKTYLATRKEAKENLESLLKKHYDEIQRLCGEIDNLKKEIKILKGED